MASRRRLAKIGCERLVREYAAMLIFVAAVLPITVMAQHTSFFPRHPATAPIRSARGVLTDFGIGNATGGFTLVDAAGKHVYYAAENLTLEGRAVDCSQPPTPTYRPSAVTCPYWPKDVVVGRTHVVVRYWEQIRPDIAKRVRVALSIVPVLR